MEVDDCLTLLAQGDGQSNAFALDCLVEQLGNRKTDECVLQLLSHSRWREVLKTLFKELRSLNLRMAGNAAYIIGLISETELGQLRLRQATPDCPEFLSDLVQLLNCDDDETIMNAVGALGTLVEMVECREWLLGQQKLLSKGVALLSCLLASKYSWTPSNASLVVARLCSSEDGCRFLLNHPEWPALITHLIESLGGEQQGFGTNSAIALGQLVDIEPTRDCLLKMLCIQDMVNGLERMLANKECSVKRNACYSVSCLVFSKQGMEKFLQHPTVLSLLENITCLISSNETQACQLAVTTLYSLVSDSSGRIKVREVNAVQATLEAAYYNSSLCNDIKEQIASILQLLVELPQPQPPSVQSTSPYTLTVSWQAYDVNTTLFTIAYELWNESKVIYCGPDYGHIMSGLAPLTTYSLRLRLKISENVSAFSPEAKVTTARAAPGAPQNFSITGRTQTQVKLRWDPAEAHTGPLKGYKVLVDDVQLLCKPVKSNSCIIPGLECGSTHQFEVMAVTSHGDSEVAVIVGGPLDSGNHCPSKPQLTMLGRREIFVSWLPPVQPMGRIMKYELKQNGQVVYSGIELQYKCKRLTPHTEYTFTVCVVTTEGRFESLPTKKRTAQDFCPTRAKLLYVHNKVKSRSGSDGLKLGNRSGLQSSRKPQGRGGLLPSVSLTHLQAGSSELPSTLKTNTTLQSLSRAQGTGSPITGRTILPKSASVGFRCRTAIPTYRQTDTTDKANSAARCTKEGLGSLVAKSQQHLNRQKERPNYERSMSTPSRPSQQMALKWGANISHTCRDGRNLGRQDRATTNAAAFYRQDNEMLPAGLCHYHNDEHLTNSDSCMTLATSISCLPRATIPSGKEKRQPVGQEKQTGTVRRDAIQIESFPIGIQHCPLKRTSHSSRSTPVVGTQTETSRQRQRGNCRFKLVAQASVPFTPASAYIPRPLPVHLRKQHQHGVHIQQHYLVDRYHQPMLQSQSQSRYIRQYCPVKDVLWDVGHSELPAKQTITPAAAKSCL